MVTESAALPADPLAEFLSATDGLLVPPLLTEADYVQKLLEFANAEDAQALHSLQMTLWSGLQLQGQVYFHALQAQENPALLALRDQLVRRLETIRTDINKARLALAHEVCQSAERVAIRPSYEITGTTVRLFYRYFPINLDAAIGHGLLLLLDASRPYGASLCRCKLPECRRFFLTIKPHTGRPRRQYCSQQHLSEARHKDSLRRVRRSRARKKALSAWSPRNRAMNRSRQ